MEHAPREYTIAASSVFSFLPVLVNHRLAEAMAVLSEAVVH
jgi:hypothetical protein